ncbi:MAG: glycosyltransferase [Paludibacteraceae bacterium]|nr:glycosyltransferase [Paludibacteraceae bacterium]
MNILFVTNKNVYPLIGGIERITYVLAQAFTNLYQYKCYSLYTQENAQGKTTDDVFAGKYLLNKEADEAEQVADCIQKWQIDIIIAQGADGAVNSRMPMLREAVNRAKRGKLLFVFHNMPGFELVKMDWAVLLSRIAHGSNIKANLKLVMMQILQTIAPKLCKKIIAPKYINPYVAADKVVLLSDKFIDSYNDFVQGDISKYAVVNNMLSYDFVTDEKVTDKQKEVVVVARMEERQKRISYALRIWRMVQKQHEDWTLNIVGYGEDLEYYKRLAQKWDLTHIRFEGLQAPLPYYRRASIFMMVSSFEGWGLTITEAQQCGCVTIAFDSFGAAQDIITDKQNGYLIPDKDINGYAKGLSDLMDNEDLRTEISNHSMESCRRFSAENIAKQWNQLFESL